MLGYILVYGTAAIGLGLLAMTASRRGRKKLKRAHRKVARWAVAGSKAALKATRLGQWVTAKQKSRKARPPRLTFGRRRTPGQPSLATRLGQYKDTALERMFGPNRVVAVSADTDQPGKPAATTPPPHPPGLHKCGAPTLARRRYRFLGGSAPQKCQRPVANDGDHCFDHGGAKKRTASSPESKTPSSQRRNS